MQSILEADTIFKIKMWHLLNGMFTNIAVACEMCHFHYPERLQSKVSKHKVWCKIINTLQARIITILHDKNYEY